MNSGALDILVLCQEGLQEWMSPDRGGMGRQRCKGTVCRKEPRWETRRPRSETQSLVAGHHEVTGSHDDKLLFDSLS